jgi:hypothetical protein
MFAVSVASPASMRSTPSSSRVRAPVDGLRHRRRLLELELAQRPHDADTWSARFLGDAGHLGETISRSRLEVGVVDVEEEAARFRASDSSRVLFEVRNTSGICVALTVPSSGIETW